ncbi:Phospholipase D [Alteripontixanthobacter maritimus]|uniref:Phospholipase D n=1 Tax=Alteripontixanthobacter maritimus TaxID=2161824 RepID=A0A369Q919_9SPHN|nr:phospholipase D-like domain-containing protein [Alteripontixanthobacter maritimus]RDC59656.1 Phospholipase D [Alteripontixanthobacter maritimus]
MNDQFADNAGSDEEQLVDPTDVSRLRESVEPGVWRYAHADRATVIVDAADYFSVMQAAMLNAQYRLMMIGWDFDTRIHLAEGRRWWQKGFKEKYPSRLGSFFVWLSRHRPSLQIKILKWSFGAFKLTFRGSMWADLLRWLPHRRIDFKFDTAHPVGCSHHQKIVVIDNALAVCGGIDMTIGRWDTREHKEHDETRKTPRGKPYQPWHDATMMVEGGVAQALDDLGRDRWIRAGGTPLVPMRPPAESIWPDGLEAQFENVEIGIARTRAKYREWDAVTEIEALFLNHIARAKKFIYAESQYFASRKVSEAILERLQEDDPPEIVIVHPAHADGWLEQQAMDHARAQIVETLQKADVHGRFSLWIPYTGDTPIYVHAKIMIIDGEVLRIGSANLNNRSLGLDSECDMFIDAARPANSHCSDAITALHHSLIAEHCGLEEKDVAGLLERHGSMAALFDATLGDGERSLRRYEPPELNDIEEGVAESAFFDPENPDDMFEAYADGGLFRKGGKLDRARRKFSRKGRK